MTDVERSEEIRVSSSEFVSGRCLRVHFQSTSSPPAVIMRESRSARGEVVTSGPRPLTWNLGKLNPEKKGVIGLFLEGGGSTGRSEWKNKLDPINKMLLKTASLLEKGSYSDFNIISEGRSFEC